MRYKVKGIGKRINTVRSGKYSLERNFVKKKELILSGGFYVTLLSILITLVSLVVAQSSEATTSNLNSQTNSNSQSDHPFYTVLEVIKSPRCINCHPTDDNPRQTDAQYDHLFGVVRGEANHGGVVLKCASCHHTENNPYSNVPGAPHWGLAPKSMGWLGLSDVEIARTLVDTSKNGGRDAEALVHHMTNDALVLWAWEPGEGREPPPVSFEDFSAALHAWLEQGAELPEEFQLADISTETTLETSSTEGAINGN